MSFNPAASFAGRRVPPWLRRFAEEPETALHDLLMGRAALGHLDAAEPGNVLLDWLRLLPADFSTAVDDALAVWIASRWGDSFPPGSAGHASLTAEAWIRVCDLIALDARLGQSAAALRSHVLAQPRFLESLSEGRARDPQGRAWQALARHQTDRSLLPQWWQMCRLPPDQPWRRGACGIDGLLFLPAKTAHLNGGFPYEAAEGLACLGAALWQRQQDGWLATDTARDEWLDLARLAEMAEPFPDRWQDFWRTAQAEPRCQAWAKWIRRLHSNLGSTQARTASRHANPNWPRRAKDLSIRIGNGDASAVGEADALLLEERHYAETSGDAEPYARSAVNFSSAARRRGWLPQALAWAESARELAPWNTYAWNNTTTCLRQLNRPEALTVAMEAFRRFPDDAVASTGLSEVLKAQDKLEDAEAQYRLAVQRFPDNAVASNGLAEVLKAQHKLEDAEAQYRQTLERFPDNAVASAGLAEVLKAQGKLEEAEAQYRLAVQRFPDSEHASTGLAEVLMAQHKIKDAEAQYRLAVERFPDNAVAHRGFAGVLLLRHKYEEAEAYYRRALVLDPRNENTQRDLQELAKLTGKLAQQTEQCRQAVQAAPEAIEPMLALAKVLNKQREFNEALDWVERILQMDPEHAATLALREKLPERTETEEPAEPPAIQAELPTQKENLDDNLPSQPEAKLDKNLPPPSLSSDEIQILTADAYLIRCWRRSTGQSAAHLLPGRMQARAQKLLERLLAFEADPWATSEAGLLEISAGDAQLALELLSQAAKRFPGSSRVRYALARAKRTVGGLASVPDWRRLARLDGRLQALALLGEGRTRLGQGEQDQSAADVLGSLGHCLQPHLQAVEGAVAAEGNVEAARKAFAEPKDNFMGWWAREVHAHLFGAKPVADAEHLPSWNSLIVNSRLAALDGLEEDFLGRYAAA